MPKRTMFIEEDRAIIQRNDANIRTEVIPIVDESGDCAVQIVSRETIDMSVFVHLKHFPEEIPEGMVLDGNQLVSRITLSEDSFHAINNFMKDYHSRSN